MNKISFSLLTALLWLASTASLEAQPGCNPDLTRPTVQCNDLVAVSIDQSGVMQVQPDWIIETALDNCTASNDLVFTFSNNPADSIRTISCADIGTVLMYQLFAWDEAGNVSLPCLTKLEVQDKLPPQIVCPPFVEVNVEPSGTVEVEVADVISSLADNCTPLADIVLELQIDSVWLPGNAQTFSCLELGSHAVAVRATDNFGNKKTCSTTLFIKDLNHVCSDCITCPPDATVSCVEAIDSLLVPFQNQNWAVFDAFGTANFDPACQPTNQNYTVSLTDNPLQLSWFTRRWTADDGAGLPQPPCEQRIFFNLKTEHVFSGKIYVDTSLNCQLDAGENGLQKFWVAIQALPSGRWSQGGSPDANGDWTATLVPLPGDTVAVAHLNLFNVQPGLVAVCPTTQSFPIADCNPENFSINFGLQLEDDCPVMTVDVGMNMIRPCFARPFSVKYCNQGMAIAEDARLEVTLDPDMSYVSASLPPTQVLGQKLIFELGDVPPLFCENFFVMARLSCSAPLGKTHCIEAHVFPDSSCNPMSNAYAGPKIVVGALCDNDTVRLHIQNVGQSDLTEERNFIVVEDIVMYRSGSFQLPAGESIRFDMPADGSTWRIEAEQASSYPFPDQPAAFVEGCGGTGQPGLPTTFPLNDVANFSDIECRVSTNSCDPNDKTAIPTGYGAQHFIKPNTDLEYLIRFQNTGTDTAFYVLIADTLATDVLDLESFQPGASSHPYRFEFVEPNVARFVFENIVLPDSGANFDASQGFVRFRIAQKPDLEDFTIIENSAAIYFDSNAAVITNVAWHTVKREFILVETDEPAIPGAQISVWPNPFSGQAVFEISGVGEIGAARFELFDPLGKSVTQRAFSGNRFVFENPALPPGTYFFRIFDEKRLLGGGRLVVR